MEPFRLRRWKARLSKSEVIFFTCARPGRSKSSKGRVPDDVVDRWVHGLPDGNTTTVISLLGRKHGPTGESEFAFYSFSGGPTLQQNVPTGQRSKSGSTDVIPRDQSGSRSSQLLTPSRLKRRR